VYVPTLFENYVADLQVDGVKFKCALWDTAGQSDFDRLRQSSYAQTDIFCICFSIDRWDSLENVLEKVENLYRKATQYVVLNISSGFLRLNSTNAKRTPSSFLGSRKTYGKTLKRLRSLATTIKHP
jgi:GTPase SAR1 family protein